MSCVSHAFASVHCCLVVTCWERADLLALVGDVYYIFVTFPCGILGQVWYLIVLIPDICLLFHLEFFFWKSVSIFINIIVYASGDSVLLCVCVGWWGWGRLRADLGYNLLKISYHKYIMIKPREYAHVPKCR